MRILLNIMMLLGLFTVTGCQTFTDISTPMVQAGTSSADQTITNSIKSALFDSGAFADASIEINTEAGVVTLTGFVKTIRQYDTAVKIASEANGVSAVRNHLVIRK